MNQEAFDLMLHTAVAPCGCRVEWDPAPRFDAETGKLLGEVPERHTCFHDENCALLPKGKAEKAKVA